MAFIDDIQSRDTALFPIVEIRIPQLNDIPVPMAELIQDMDDWYDSGFYPSTDWSGFEVGQYIKIDNEIMKIWLIVGGYTIRVHRGLFNTDIVSHLIGAIVYRLGWINISTKDFTLDNTHYNPLLLSTPSIKESIDLENRKYKISNVSLKISNVEYNGERFSDSQITLNTEVLIHWVSPSCTYLGECYLAYKGTVRAITHDEKTCSITLEDISQSTLHRDVPVALLGTEVSIPDKYKNKPIPMVYGEVDKSPCVVQALIGDNEEGSSFDVLADSDDSITYLDGNILNDNENPASLWIFEEESWLNIPQHRLTNFDYYDDWVDEGGVSHEGLGITNDFQYEIISNTIQIKTVNRDNLPAFDMIQVIYIPELSCKRVFSAFDTDPVVVTDRENIYDNDSGTYAYGEGTIGIEVIVVPNVGTIITERPFIIESILSIPSKSSSPIKVAPMLKFSIESFENNANLIEAKIGFDIDLFYQQSGGVSSNTDGNIVSFIETSIGSGIELKEHNIPFADPILILEQYEDLRDIPPLKFKIGYNHDLFPNFGLMQMNTNIYEVSVALIFDIEKLNSRNFYANVQGRTSL